MKTPLWTHTFRHVTQPAGVSFRDAHNAWFLFSWPAVLGSSELLNISNHLNAQQAVHDKQPAAQREPRASRLGISSSLEESSEFPAWAMNLLSSAPECGFDTRAKKEWTTRKRIDIWIVFLKCLRSGEQYISVDLSKRFKMSRRRRRCRINYLILSYIIFTRTETRTLLKVSQ